MAYTLLIVEPRGQRAERTPDEAQRAYADMVRFGRIRHKIITRQHVIGFPRARFKH